MDGMMTSTPEDNILARAAKQETGIIRSIP